MNDDGDGGWWWLYYTWAWVRSWDECSDDNETEAITNGDGVIKSMAQHERKKSWLRRESRKRVIECNKKEK